jgi:hypothetical protein
MRLCLRVRKVQQRRWRKATDSRVRHHRGLRGPVDIVS